MSAPAFDPFTSSNVDAASQPDAYSAQGAIAQWNAAQFLRRDKDKYETTGILDGIAMCLRVGLTPPTWLWTAFTSALAKGHQDNSWDAAFGTPSPKRTRMAPIRLKEKMRWELFAFFVREDAPQRNKAGFKIAAAAFGITPRQAEEWTPKTRKNARGHKPYRESTRAEGSAHDPFGLAAKTRKTG